MILRVDFDMKEARIVYGFYSQNHKRISKHLLSCPYPILGKSNASKPKSRYWGKYYVSADEPRIVEVTAVGDDPEMSRTNYKWDDVVSIGRIYLNSFMRSIEYDLLSEKEKQEIINKYWDDK